MNSIRIIAALINIILYPSFGRSFPLPRRSSLQYGDGVINFPDAVFILETKYPIPKSDVDEVIRWAEDKKKPIQIGEHIVIKYRVANISVKSGRPFDWYEYAIRLVPTVDSQSLDVLLRHGSSGTSYLHTVISYVDNYPIVFHNLWFDERKGAKEDGPPPVTVKWTTESITSTTMSVARDTEPTTTIKPFESTPEITQEDIDLTTTTATSITDTQSTLEMSEAMTAIDPEPVIDDEPTTTVRIEIEEKISPPNEEDVTTIRPSTENNDSTKVTSTTIQPNVETTFETTSLSTSEVNQTQTTNKVENDITSTPTNLFSDQTSSTTQSSTSTTKDITSAISPDNELTTQLLDLPTETTKDLVPTTETILTEPDEGVTTTESTL